MRLALPNVTPPIELLTTATAERYRSAVTSTVDRLADRFAAADRPTTDTAEGER